MSFRSAQRALRGRVTFLAAIACLVGLLPATAAQAASPRVDLRVLVVTDGGPNVSAIAEELALEGVPYTLVDLRSSSRPLITAGFLSDTVSTGPRAKFQSVVLPNDRPAELAEAEMQALTQFESAFGVRQVDAYTYPSPAVGLNYDSVSGELDGKTGSLTQAGLSGAFRYLRGSVPIADNDSSVTETYGYLATPVAGAAFTPLLTVPANGTARPVAGVFTGGGREQLVVTATFNSSQTWYRLIAHGLVTWMTRGVHLGYNRSYFAVQVDDVLLPDARWSTAARCTPGDDCPAGTAPTPDIRMTAADVTVLQDWQTANGLKLDVTYNAEGSVAAIAANGRDPLTDALLANKSSLRWLNHTYSHPYLGCVQDFSVTPWQCQRDSSGNIVWTSRTTIDTQINQNRTWAANNGVTINAGDLVTGEHSGLASLPQQSSDNPNLAPSVDANGVAYIASDASREPMQRAVGGALTVPRHPMNIFYNVATAKEEVNEYNWIYTSTADGGSGACTASNSTCIRPLSEATGFQDYIVPVETRIALSHVLANDPRPHYVHQSNLTEGRILYPVLNEILRSHGGLFADNAGLVNLSLGQQGLALERAAAWKKAQSGGAITAYTLAGKLYVQSSSSSKTHVPVTVPTGTSFGVTYGGERSDYTPISNKRSVTLTLGTSTS